MTLLYYIDNDGQKKGPYSGSQLKWFVKQGEITPDTVVENEDGTSVPAREVKCLDFSETETYALTPPPPTPPVETNPFAAPMPVEQNPFAAPMPVAARPFTAPLPQNIATPAVQGNTDTFGKTIVRTFKIIIVILILAAVAGTVGPILWESRKLSAAAGTFIEEVLTDRPLKIADFSVKPSIQWTDKPTYFEMVKSFWGNILNSEDVPISLASGTFFIEAKTTEKLYQSVGIEEGLRELGISDLHDRALNDATEKLQDLPIAHQDDLRKALPQDMPAFQFHKVLVPEDEKETLTGSIELTKDGKDWQEDGIQVDPYSFGDDFTPESRLQDAHKLDDPATKTAVQTVIRNRKDFVAKVDGAFADLKKRNEITVASIQKELADPSLEVFDDSAISVEWTTEETGSASGTFSGTTKTREKLYQSVSKEDGLQELEITVTHEQEFDAATERIKSLPESHKADLTKLVNAVSELSEHQFYSVRSEKGREVTRTGSVELTKNANEDWQVGILIDSSDNFTPESKLGADADKIDDRKTKESVDAIIRDRKSVVDRLKPIYDFDEFCKPGKRYTGSFEAFQTPCEVRVVFERFEQNTDIAVRGTITFFHPGGQVDRPFSVGVKIGERTGYSIAGAIDNSSLPSLQVFIDRLGEPPPAPRPLIRNFYSTMERYEPIEVQFTESAMTFFVDLRNNFLPLPGAPDRLKISFAVAALAEPGPGGVQRPRNPVNIRLPGRAAPR